ncbi:phosphoribosyltransferase [[Eubacterium] cellulosolvens]
MNIYTVKPLNLDAEDMFSNVVEERVYREKTLIFNDRIHAGKLLAQMLKEYCNQKDVIVLGIPSGGVPVGSVVAKEIHVPFDVLVVRKIQIPWNTEAGFGAVTGGGDVILNEPLIEQLGLTKLSVDEVIAETKRVVEERLKKFGGKRPPPSLQDKIVLLVDDGLASGYTMLVAARYIRRKEPREIVIAVPTASEEAIKLLAPEADKIMCLNIRGGPVFAVADAYIKWHDLSDEEVKSYLSELSGVKSI